MITKEHCTLKNINNQAYIVVACTGQACLKFITE